jgi:hypothetical protein
MELITALVALEQAAAAVGHLLPDDDEALQVVAAAWGPLRPKGGQRERWDAYWIAWLQDCADRLPPAEADDQPDAEELQELIVRWAQH